MYKRIPIFLIFIFIFSGILSAQTPVSGSVSGTWTSTGNPYQVTDGITVASGNILTIQPGVEIQFQVDTSFVVEGTLNAQGTEAEPVIFTVDPVYITQFSGIRFLGGGGGTISYALIENGFADGAAAEAQGGGIYCNAASPTISNTIIRDCQALTLGGGIALQNSSTVVEYCDIYDNTASYAGGIYVNSNATIRKNRIHSNTGTNVGGGINLDGVNSPTVENNLIYGNQSNNDGGGLVLLGGNTSHIYNNLIYSNTATDDGGGIYSTAAATNGTITNTVIWGNSAGGDGEQIGINTGNFSIDYSNVMGGQGDIWVNTLGVLDYGDNNIVSDPDFEDAPNADFHFDATSSLVDAGINTGAPGDDFDDNDRPYDGDRDDTETVDIGPYEYINTPPEITSDPELSVDEDDPYTYQVVAVDPDAGEDLTYALTTAPAFLSIDEGTGEITGTPGNDDVASHPVTVRVTDLNGEFDTQAYTLEVVEVNDPPVVDDIPGQTIAEGGVFTAIVLNNYVEDPDHLDSEISWVASGNVDLTVTISGANVATISIPNANWYGSETITFTATDGGGLTDFDAATFEVTPVNDPPIITDITNRSIAEGGSFASIDLDDYVEDADNPDDELTWTSSATTNFNVTITNRVAMIVPINPEWNGSETVTFTVEDPDGLTDNDAAMFTVTAVNDPPVVANILNQTIAEGGSFVSINLDDFVSDVDNADTEISWTSSATTNITVTITNRVATITANNVNWNGSETVTFTAEDLGGLTDSDDAMFTVTAVNDPPVVTDIPNQTIPEGGSFTEITLDNYVSDLDNVDAEISWTASATTNITVTITDRVAIITANNPEWNGSEQVTFTAEDPGGLTDSDDASFTVSALNDPPVVADIPDQSIAEGDNFTSISMDDYVSDADNSDAEISWTASTTTNITVTITDRVATITLNDPEWNGSESVTFTAEDPNGLTDSDDAMFTVTPVNDPPAVSDIPAQTIPEDGSFTAITLDNYVSDPDNADADISWTASATTNLTVTITDRVATITVNDPEWGGYETVTFTAEDLAGLTDSDDALFTVSAVNDPPQIAPISELTFNEDDSLLTAIATLYDYVEDPDNPDSLLIITVKAGQYVITYVDSPNVVMKAPANWNGTDTLEVKVSDGELADSVKVAVMVKSINDVPLFVDLPDTVSFDNDSDTTLTMNQFATDVDLPNDNLSWSFEVSNTALNIDFDDGSTDLTLSAPGFSGVVKVKCTVTDDSSASVTDSFYVEVIEPTAIEDMTDIIPLAYQLDQNYPNPFNPITHIQFGMKKAGIVKIEVYNVLGQKVMTLFDGYKEAGYHILKFNAGSLSSGLYFYRMNTKEFSSIKKMILMK